MLLSSVSVTNSQGSVLELPLEDISEGFILKGIDGLDPVKANIVSSSFANLDGETYKTSRREARDLIFHLGIEPDYANETVKTLRDKLYLYLMPKSRVMLGFHLESAVAELDLLIEARVEDFEAPLFVKDPAADITLRCPNPDFYDPIPVVLSSESISDLSDNFLVNYLGNIETGLVLTVEVDRSVSDITIYHTAPDNIVRSVEFSYALLAGDVLEINSNVGSKGVYLTRGGTRTSILYAITPQSNWVQLQPGDNNYQVYIEGDPVPFSIEYITKYGGL